tara:strand:- start:7029 stop:7523 length:495 start_codon:yes stop_codon:yes gene_type:complete
MMSTIILENSMIECNLTELLLDFTFIKNRLIELSKIKADDKIYIWDNKIYLDETPSLIQPIARFITGQSRYNIQLFLHNQFKEYSAILNKIEKCCKVLPEEHPKYKLLWQLVKTNLFFIDKILPGLYHIKKYYHDNPPNIDIALHPIIYNLTLFKNKHIKNKEL